IIVLNPAEPPLIMRDTVYVLCEPTDPAAITASIRETVAKVAEYVPGYRMLKEPIIDEVSVSIPDLGDFTGLKVTCLLEVEGAAHYLPKYAGNLDIMTSAALRMGEKIAQHLERKSVAAG
ncbi:MAG: acetaldehyde dehydrogenase (acetylating), partial [bacterium]|nr:acetaldehyde dehydrogenase (acetylating) [Candidatus Kapabacteria bacterium]